jgi:quercetin dioxygenase-like cupin family protein
MAAYTWVNDLPGMIGDLPEGSILSRTVYRDNQIKVVLFGFTAGQSLSQHSSAQPAVIHILSGEATITLGGDVKQAGAGTWLWMPACQPHSLFAKTPVTMLLMLLSSEDDLKKAEAILGAADRSVSKV